jgi:Protein of unknown function (DUF3107)
VEVKIGIQWGPRELVVETASSADDVQRALAAAVAEGSVFILADDKGGQVMVPADKIAYVELGSPGPRRVGFGNAP